MKAPPKRTTFLVLGILLILTALGWVFLQKEPVHEGKTVSEWFGIYTVQPAVVSDPQGTSFSRTLGPNGWIEERWSPNPLHTEARDALLAFGPKAVPYLVRKMDTGSLDRAYRTAFTNLPPSLRRNLPNPWRRAWERACAAELLGKMGSDAEEAIPALLRAIKSLDASLRRSSILALKRVGADRRQVSAVLRQLGARRNYAGVVDVAWEAGWEGDEVAKLLGRILREPDVNLRRRAITLLERAQADAAPALIDIIAALKDSDKEVRYLAARALEAIGANAPPVIEALQAALNDEHDMVRTVARRVLSRNARMGQ